MPSEKLDNTTHDKIFVLNNDSTKDEIDVIVNKIDKYKDKLSSNNATEIKSLLSSILLDYNPRKINVKSSLVHDDDKNSKAKA